MTIFQWIAVPVLSLVLLLEFIALFRRPGRRRLRLFRALIWAAAAVAIAQPMLPQRLANAVGIQRGADLVFYLFVLAFIAASFYFYSRYLRLQRQVTELVRHLAILEARRERQPSKLWVRRNECSNSDGVCSRRS